MKALPTDEGIATVVAKVLPADEGIATVVAMVLPTDEGFPEYKQREEDLEFTLSALFVFQ